MNYQTNNHHKHHQIITFLDLAIVELSEEIYDCMQDFLPSNPSWNQRRLINASMSLFLIQNHSTIKPQNYRACSQQYLHSVCAVAPAHYSPTKHLI